VNGYVVEFFGRDSNPFYRLGTNRIRVGRAFDNDVVLTVRAVSPHHLELFVDDAQRAGLTNLSEENGTWLRGKPVKGSVALASTPCVIELGASVIRVHVTDAEVAPTQRLRRGGPFEQVFATGGGAGVLPFVVWRVLVRSCSVSPILASVFVMVSCAGLMYAPIFAAYEEFGHGPDENRNLARYPHELLAWDLRFKSNRTIGDCAYVALKLRAPPMSADVSNSAAVPGPDPGPAPARP
jgi:hypothetical protein